MFYQETKQSLSLTDYYKIFDRHKWAIAFILLIFIILTIIHNSRLVPIYSATTTMIIDKETQSPISGQDRSYESYLSETLTFQTHFQMITSVPVLKRVVEILELDKKNTQQHQMEVDKVFPFRQYIKTFKNNLNMLLGGASGSSGEEATVAEDPATMIARSLKGIINVEQIEETRLFKLTVTHTDPVMAKDTANTLAQAYIDYNIDTRMKATQNTFMWLTKNLEEMKKNLTKAEEEFTAFKQKEQLISIEKNQEMIAQKIRDFNNSYIEARNRRLEIEAKLEQLKQISQSQRDIPQLRSLITNPLIDSLYSELITEEAELSKLTNIYKEKHPKVIQIQTKIAGTKNTIRDEIKKELHKLETERSVLLSKEKVIQNTIADFKREAMDTGKKELSHNILQRNVEMNQKLYDAILTSLKETNITQNLDVSNIRIMEKAMLPAYPIGPDKKRNLILSIIIGLMLGIGYSLTWEYLDRSLKTEEDVQRYMNLPVLGIIPKTDRKKQ